MNEDQNQPKSKEAPLHYELRIGVTGHRDLADSSAVRKAVDQTIDRTRDVLNQKKNGVPLQWVVVSPLAKGADRIVAQSMFDRNSAKLEVITPLPLDEHRITQIDSNAERSLVNLPLME